MSFIIVIPARYSSTRIPKKPLVDINGKAMIMHVIDRIYESGADRIIVATDHEEIANVINKTNVEICMTNINHKSGTERLAEVIKKYNFHDEKIIINIQCDVPMISSDIINKLLENFMFRKAEMSTLAVYISNIEDALNHNVVKVVIDREGYALYFSRSIIPWKKNLFYFDNSDDKCLLLKHIGIYIYRAGFIKRYVTWNPSPLEKVEMLEQLRVLWYGKKIYVYIIKETCLGISVDTPEDLSLVRTLIN